MTAATPTIALHPRDPRSLQLAIAKNIHRLRGIAGKMLGNPHDAEDAVQDALLRAHRALPQFRGESSLFTWLYRITLSSASNMLRQRRRRLTHETTVNHEPSADTQQPEGVELETPESALATRRLHALVRDVFARLPEDQRVALELREVDGLSYDEIAAQTGAPVGTVRSRIFRARERIAVEIKSQTEVVFRHRAAPRD